MKLSDEEFNELRERVIQFQMMQLPGQPMMMHVGTSNLVEALWITVRKLNSAEELK